MRFERLRGFLATGFVLALLVTAGGAVVSVLAEEKSEAPAAEKSEASKSKLQTEPDAAVTAAMLRDQGEECLVAASALEDMRIKREELLLKTKLMSEREAEISAKEKALKEEMDKLQLIREEIGLVDAARKKENEERVAKLVETFETMSAKAAAQILSALDETLAVAAIGRMSTPKLAKILNVMDTGRSSRLAESLAGVVRARRAQALASSNGEAVTANSGKGGEKNEQSQQSNSSDSNSSRSPSSSEPAKAKQ